MAVVADCSVEVCVVVPGSDPAVSASDPPPSSASLHLLLNRQLVTEPTAIAQRMDKGLVLHLFWPTVSDAAVIRLYNACVHHCIYTPLLLVTYLAGLVISGLVLMMLLPAWCSYFGLLAVPGSVLLVIFVHRALVRALLRCFELWFLQAQIVGLALGLGFLFEWNVRVLSLVTAAPGVMCVILTDAIVLPRAIKLGGAMLGTAFLAGLAARCFTGTIHDDDQPARLIVLWSSYQFDLIDFIAARAITVLLFFAKNLVSIIRRPHTAVMLTARRSIQNAGIKEAQHSVS